MSLTENGKRRVYRVLCYLSHADGDLHEREQAFLAAARRKLGLSEEEGAALAAEAAEGEVALKDDPEEMEIAVTQMAKLLVVDGVLHPEEVGKLKRIARLCGIEPGLLPKLLKAAMIRQNQAGNG